MRSPRHVLAHACLLAALGAAAPATAQPAAQPRDRLLDQLAGRWQLTRQIRGKEVHNTVQADWVLNEQFLRIHMKDVATPPRYEAIVLVGWQAKEQRYVAYWADTYGPSFAAVGYGTRDGNTIPFVFQYPDGPFYNTFSWNEGDGTWTMRLEASGKDGARTPFAVDALRR